MPRSLSVAVSFVAIVLALLVARAEPAAQCPHWSEGDRMREQAPAGRHAGIVPEFRFDAQGRFVFFQLSDIHVEYGVFTERHADLVRRAAARFHPALAIVTGDIDNARIGRARFVATVRPFIEMLVGLKLPFAITFGNHDSERVGPDSYTGEEQWALYRELGGSFFVDYDVPELSGVGNGVIPVRPARRSPFVFWKRDAPLFNLFIMDSGDYVPGDSAPVGDDRYDGPWSDQIRWYEEHSGRTPCLWFQHIIVPDVVGHGIIFVTNNVPGAFKDDFGRYLMLNPARSVGALNETPCPTTIRDWPRTNYVYQGRTLYQSWIHMGNLKGAYFGHDHQNTFDGVDANGVRLGACRSLTLSARSDNDPGFRVFILHADGTYETDTISEHHPDGTGLLGRTTPPGPSAAH